MSLAVQQREHRGQLLEIIETLSRRASLLRDTLTADQLAWHPPEGGWSIGQVFEHLCVTNDSYLGPMRRLIESAKSNGTKARSATWRPTVMGNFMARSLRSPRRLPAPKPYRPGPSHRADVIGAFLERQGQVLELLERSLGVVWKALKMPSPVTSLIRLNLGDALTVLVVHMERHFAQIERIRTAPGFPS